jgi:hypothetical protein
MKYGTFVHVPSGKEMALSEPGAAFPILCGRWPNEHEEAIQRMCSCCTEPIGVSPQGIEFHDAAPEIRPLLCKGCFALLVYVSKNKPDATAFLAALAKAEKPDGY